MRVRLICLLALAAVPAALFLSRDRIAAQGAKPRPGRLSAEEQAALVPGLSAAFTSNTKTDTRRVRLAALHVPAGGPPTPFLPAGPFAVKFVGYLKTAEKGDYTLRVEGTGTAKVTLNENPVVELKADVPKPVELVKGYNRIVIEYAAPEKGPATFRLWWAGDGFAEEPLPPDSLFTRGDEEALSKGTALRDGRAAFADFGCVSCHAVPATKDAEAAMPELARTPPNLEKAADRFGPAWLAAWVADPKSLRPEALMPAVLKGTPDEIKQQAADLAVYLAGPAGGEAPKADAKLAEAGEKLFETLGCIGCHQTDSPKEKDKYERLTLHFAPAKFRPGKLAEFLKAPHAHYPWSRMPNFKLDPAKEIPPLAAYLTNHKAELPEPAKGDAERGQKLFASAGCVNCHATGDKVEMTTLRAAPKDATAGCLADDPKTGKAPDYGLDALKRKALRSFVSAGYESLARDTAAEFAGRQMEALQCTGCHRRDSKQGRLYKILEEENVTGLPPQPMPNLTWAGEKLKPEWTVKLLKGEIDHKARPWLKARMPAFPARAEVLAAGLSHEHGYAEAEDTKPAPDAELAKVGATLMPQAGGLNCVQCHAVGETPAVAPFEAPGINLKDAALRLRHSYYPRWMLDPTRVDPSTKMPRFAPDLKTTTLKDVYDGDAKKQFGALWHHIQTLGK